jgi:tetratricopeptide (TPR) repeat protein
VVEFNEILLRACAKDLDRRYQTADEMRTELELLQRGRSVKQKRTAQGRLRIVKKVCAIVALLALSAAALVTFLRRNVFDTSNPAHRLSENALATKEYLEGDECCRRDTTEGLAQALDHFSRAIAKDPKFTMAYNGLFEVYIRGVDLGLSHEEASAKLRTCASKLMELDAKLAEAHAAQAYVDFCDRKWNIAEPRFRHAIKLNPKCAMAHNRYGFCLYTAGRADDGLEELQLADRLDPTRPRIKRNIGSVFYVKRQFREAIDQYQQAIKLQPSYPGAHKLMGCAYRALWNYTNAIDEFEKSDILVGKDERKVKQYFDQHRRAYANGGPSGYWSNYLAEAQMAHRLYWQAVCQAHLNNYPQALTLLEQACATNDESLVQSLCWDECWDVVHTDPRFIAILTDVGLTK